MGNLQHYAHLYKARITAETGKDLIAAAEELHNLNKLKNSAEFVKKHQADIYSIQDTLIRLSIRSKNINRNVEALKRISELYLYKYKLPANGSSGNLLVYTGNRKAINELRHYSYLLTYTRALKHSFLPKKDTLAAQKAENSFLKNILKNAMYDQELASFYNDIYEYLLQSNPADKMFKIAKLFAEQNDFTPGLPIGNFDSLKHTINYRVVEQHLAKTPASAEKSVPELAGYLCKFDNPADNVYAIYEWIQTNIFYDTTYVDAYNQDYQASEYANEMVRVKQSASVVLENKQAVCEGITDLFTALCTEAGIHAQSISGQTAGVIYLLGEHAWNTVEIDGKYYLLDATWDKDENFIASPASFAVQHHAQAKYQLLFFPYSKPKFFENLNKYASKIQRAKPDHEKITLNRAKLLYKESKYSEAKEVLVEYGQRFKKGFDYYYLAGKIYFNNYEYDSALVNLERASQIIPEHDSNIRHISLTYLKKNQFDSALFYADKSIEITPFDNGAWRTKGLVLIDMKRYDEAYSILDSICTTNPKDYVSLSNLAKVLFFKQQYHKAIKTAYQVIEQVGYNNLAYEIIGHSESKLGNYQKSIEIYDIQLKHKPGDNQTMKSKAFSLFMLNKYTEAYEIMKEVTKKMPYNPYNHDNLAFYALLAGDYDIAIKHAKISLDLNPESAASNSLALAYIMTNKWSEAEKIYLANKDKTYLLEPQYDTYGDFYLHWLNYLIEHGYSHPDFKKAKRLLAK